jgi:hypothetical protein
MTEWTTFGRSRERFIVIAYDEYRQHKRKFRVTVYGHDRSFGHLYHACESFHLTFDAATKAAQKYAVQFAT